MNQTDGRFSDLMLRTGSGLAIAAVGLWAIWSGGAYFLILVAVAVVVLLAELHRMLDPQASSSLTLAVSGLGGLAILGGSVFGPPVAYSLAILPILAGVTALTGRRAIWLLGALLIVLAGLGLILIRENYGPVWLLWLVLVVVASDVLGYFAGRAIGGPKFWPRVSPKKTWSGTVAGWIGAVAVGAGFLPLTGAGPELLLISVAVCMAAQAGDILESAVKRKVGVKDASNLLPGHGGALDRFDGLLGATLFVLVLTRYVALGG